MPPPTSSGLSLQSAEVHWGLALLKDLVTGTRLLPGGHVGQQVGVCETRLPSTQLQGCGWPLLSMPVLTVAGGPQIPECWGTDRRQLSTWLVLPC